MAAFFALSLLGVVVMGGAMIRYLWIRTGATAIVTDDTETGKHLGEFLQRQSEEAKAKTLVQSLGSFTVELKAIPGSLSAPGVMNLAQVEIVVQCDTKETCAYIDRNQAPAKNQVIGVFISLDRDELLSREGKKRLRRKLIERLNSWLQNGRIEDVFFSKLIVS